MHIRTNVLSAAVPLEFAVLKANDDVVTEDWVIECSDAVAVKTQRGAEANIPAAKFAVYVPVADLVIEVSQDPD